MRKLKIENVHSIKMSKLFLHLTIQSEMVNNNRGSFNVPVASQTTAPESIWEI